MRIGMLGVGRIGALHAETSRLLAEVNELILVETDAARARKVASKTGAPWAEDANNS